MLPFRVSGADDDGGSDTGAVAFGHRAGVEPFFRCKDGGKHQDRTAEKAGSDLVANAAWALSNALFPCVVVDLGTATTFTVLDQTGALIGTAICAGVDISLDALKKADRAADACDATDAKTRRAGA